MVFGIDVFTIKYICTTPLIIVTGKLSDSARVIQIGTLCSLLSFPPASWSIVRFVSAGTELGSTLASNFDLVTRSITSFRRSGVALCPIHLGIFRVVIVCAPSSLHMAITNDHAQYGRDVLSRPEFPLLRALSGASSLLLRAESHPSPTSRSKATATSVIHEGTTLISVLPLSTSLLPSSKEQRCDFCFRPRTKGTNLYKCTKCAAYWYCGSICMFSPLFCLWF